MIAAQVVAFASVAADESEDQMRKLIDDAGPIAMLFIVLLGVALFFLWRSMNRQMKNIDPALPSDEEAAAEERESAAERDPDDDVPPAH